MAKKKLTPEEEAAKKAEAKPKPAKPSAQDMSGGAVKPAPKANAAAKGASAMDDFLSGTRADGSYMSGSERKAAFQATRDARFTMPGQAPVERAIVPVQQVDRTLATTAQPAANAAEANAAKMAQAAGDAATRGGRLTRALKSPVTLGTTALVAEALIPRSDDSTDAGYDLNTARDAVSSGIGYGMLGPMVSRAAPYLANKVAPQLAKGPWPAKATAAALAALGAGSAAYDRLSDYSAANPEADQRDYELPKADVNLWSQAPAALSDAGRVASQILRGVGDGTSYLLNNYTPYPYLKRANDAVADYLTPPSMKSAAPAEQAPEPEAPRQDLVREALAGPLPPNTELLPNGQLQQKLYGKDGTFYGTATGSLEQMNRLAAPSEEEKQERARQQVEDNIQRRLFAERLQKEQEWRERTSPEAAQRWFAQKRSEAELRDALNRGGSQDPALNAEKVQDIVDAVSSASALTGRPIEELLPENGNRNVRIAREVLARQASLRRSLTPQETGLLSLAMTPGSAPNYYGDDETRAEALRKQAASSMVAAANDFSSAEQEQRLLDSLTLDQRKFSASQAEAEAAAAAAPAAAEKERRDYEEWRRDKAIKSLQDAVKDRASAMNTAGADPKAKDSLDQLDQIIRLNARAAIEAGVPENEVNSMLTAGQPTAQESSQPSAASIEYLRANPDAADQFDAKFGPGSADKYLNS